MIGKTLFGAIVFCAACLVMGTVLLAEAPLTAADFDPIGQEPVLSSSELDPLGVSVVANQDECPGGVCPLPRVANVVKAAAAVPTAAVRVVASVPQRVVVQVNSAAPVMREAYPVQYATHELRAVVHGSRCAVQNRVIGIRNRVVGRIVRRWR